MKKTLVCSLEAKLFIQKDQAALSPVFDLDSYVESESNRPNNLFTQKDSEKAKEICILRKDWNQIDACFYLVNGEWMRRWIDYIFVPPSLRGLPVGGSISPRTDRQLVPPRPFDRIPIIPSGPSPAKT